MTGKKKTYTIDSPVFIEGHVQRATIDNWHKSLDVGATIDMIQQRGINNWPGFYLEGSYPVQMLEMYTILARHGDRLATKVSISDRLMLAAKHMVPADYYKGRPVSLMTERDQYNLCEVDGDLTLGALLTQMQEVASARWLCLLASLPYLTGLNEHFLFPSQRISATPAMLVALSVMCGFKIAD